MKQIFAFFLLFTGIILLAVGSFFWWQRSDIPDAPIPFPLANIELKRDRPPLNIELGECLANLTAICPGPRIPLTNNPDQPPKVAEYEYFYYPVVSFRHPDFQTSMQIASRFGGHEQIPPQILQTWKDPAVLVRTTAYHRTQDIPKRLVLMDKLPGILIGFGSDLKPAEQRRLQSAYPQIQLDSVRILLESGKPRSMLEILTVISGGLVFLGLAFFVFSISSNGDNNSPGRRFRGHGLRNQHGDKFRTVEVHLND